MGLPETMFGRIRVYFARKFPHRKVDGPKQKLGTDALGFDTIVIQGKLRDDLNSNEFGFADVLNRPIPRKEFDEESSLGDVRDFIIDNTDLDGIAEYEVKMNERVRLSVRTHVARLARPPVDPKDVLRSDPLSKYCSDQATVGRLQSRLNEDLAKYLFREIPLGDLQGQLSTIQSRIVDRTII
jgi:hypothetical protein